jgi:hypothetical protein
MTQQLAGKRILIVEDDGLISENLACEIATEGGKVIGPAETVEPRSMRSRIRTWTPQWREKDALCFGFAENPRAPGREPCQGFEEDRSSVVRANRPDGVLVLT